MGILISDPTGKIEKINPYGAKMFGYELSELIGEQVEKLIPVRMRDAHIENRNEYIANPEPRVMGDGGEILAVKKNGEEFYVEIGLSSYKSRDAVNIVSFINDVSENKKSKQRLKSQTEKLEDEIRERTLELSKALREINYTNENLQEEINKRIKSEEQVKISLEKERELGELKSRFVAMASHEFRTPLASIVSSVSLISKYDRSEDQDKRLKHVNNIKKSVNNLTSILNDFLSHDKLEQGMVSARPVEFEFVGYCKDIKEQLGEVFRDDSRAVKLQIDENSKMVYQDPDIIRNILSNLLSNAFKYSPKEEEVVFDLSFDEKNIKIDIIDKGIGIPKGDQGHLFSRFYRASNTIGIQGTGLGLNIVQKYLSYVDGSLSFESEENEGSTFSLVLPLRLEND